MGSLNVFTQINKGSLRDAKITVKQIKLKNRILSFVHRASLYNARK